MIIRSRIAPTPSGYLHLGNAYNFLLTEQLTHHLEGSLRLRIDDLDADRVRPEYIEDIFGSLHWLGITTDKGPTNPEEQEAEFSQRFRNSQYQEMLLQLVQTGEVFACNCSRAQIAGHSADGLYPGTCREKAIPLDTPEVTWRMKTEREDSIHWMDGISGGSSVNLYDNNRDFIIRKKDGLPAYQLASLHDDIAYGINLIVRGEDLLGSTAAQLFLAKKLAITSFQDVDFYHHPLLENDGHKLSKSAGSLSLKALRKSGVSVGKIREDFAKWALRIQKGKGKN